MGGRPALFLDRDGVINVEVHRLHRPEDVVVIPGVKETIGKRKPVRLVSRVNHRKIELMRGRIWPRAKAERAIRPATMLTKLIST